MENGMFGERFQMDSVLYDAKVGVWYIELDEGAAPRMYADRAMLELLGIDGIPGPEACYEHWHSRIEEGYLGLVEEAVETMLLGRHGEVSYGWQHPAWGKIYVRCGGTLDRTYVQGSRLCGYHQNISELVSLKKENEKYQSIYKFTVDNEYDGIAIVDLKTGKADFKAGKRGEADRHLVDSVWSRDVNLRFVEEFMCPEDQKRYMEEVDRKNILRRLNEGEKAVHFYYKGGVRQNGRHKELNIRYFDEKKSKLFICIRDIEQQTQMEEKSKEALEEAFAAAKRANEAKSEFLTKMSHDIRTPMNAIVGMTVIAEANIDDRERVAECLGKIKTANRHLLELVNEVLDMSRIESGKLNLSAKELDLTEVLQEVISMVQPQIEEKGQELTVEIGTIEHSKVTGDDLRLQKVFNNILSNAVKYTQAGGHIKVSAEELDSIYGEYGCYRFVFQDNGYGMSEEFQKKIFQPFERAEDSRVAEQEGTGLGMSIVYNLVQLMRGEIQVKSVLNQGSEFTVILYLKLQNGETQKEPEQHVEEELAGQKSFPGKRVLLVEDNELNVEIAREIMKMFDLEVAVAYNGKEAVERYQKEPEGYFDLVFMDIQMPVMNGYEAAEKIRAAQKGDSGKIPIVAMTANAFAEDVKKAADAGMDGHLAKPIDLDQMIEIMTKWLS